jgi:diamine N-acetyltransferase
MRLTADTVYLRPVNNTDAEFILRCENDFLAYNGGIRTQPYTAKEIDVYINEIKGLRQDGQLRFIIVKIENDTAIGTIDLFDLDEKRREVSIGVLITEEADRRQGFAHESLESLIDFCGSELENFNLNADVPIDNLASRSLFLKSGFVADEHHKTKTKMTRKSA